MEQAKVTEFFPVIKNASTSFSSHPAKRRKVEEATTSSIKLLKKLRSKGIRQLEKRKTQRNKTKNDLTVSALITATPLSHTVETTSQADGHDIPKRKLKKTLQNKLVKGRTINTIEGDSGPSLTDSAPSLEKDFKESSDKIKINPWISDQAKLVLAVGRSCAALTAAYNRDCQLKDKTLKASDVLKQTSHTQVSTSKGNIREEYLKKYQESIKCAGKKGRLRDKFSHLLEGTSSETKHTSDSCKDTKPKSRIPAHERFKHLACKASEESFVLPRKYKLLLDIFRTVDSVLFLLHRRSETCTFERLKTSVQSMLGRKFSEKHLAQMKTVLPSAFVFRIEKNLRDLNGLPSKPQLTIDANFEEALLHENGSKSDINQTVLITRRHMFESALTGITKKHHQGYLKKLHLEISDDELHRWHPHFKVEEVPDIEESLLPQAASIKVVTSAKDILGRSHNNPQVERALQNIADSSSKKQTVESPPPSTTYSNTEHSSPSPSSLKTNAILKGVSISLLERIKEKEKKKAELAMLRDPKQEKRLAMMDKLPDVVRIIKTYFISEKKAAIPIEDCVVKVSQSYSSATASCDIEEQIKLLHELVPDWLSLALVRKCLYVKISKTLNVNHVLEKLQSIKDQEANK